jgi:hypothetical protein
MQRVVIRFGGEFDGHFLLGAASFRFGAFPK